MAIGFFAAVKVSFFLITIADKKQEEKEAVVTANANPIKVINERGKELFSENCNACHALSHHNFLTGITERVPNRLLLRAFIRNSQKVIQSGEPYFVKMYESYNSTAMYSFPELTDKDIDDIIEYIEQRSN